MALLVAGVAARGPGRRQGTISTIILAGIGGLDLYAALRTTHSAARNGGRHAGGAGHRAVRAAATIRRSPEEVYRFWHDMENLPSFMHHLKSVTSNGDGRSHWVANAPVGESVEWDALITEDRPDQRIAWQSLPGSLVENAGSVEFAPTPDGNSTEVRVTIGYHLPGGALGKAAATLSGESPDQQVNDDLRRIGIADGRADACQVVAGRRPRQCAAHSRRQRSVCRRQRGFNHDRCASHVGDYPRTRGGKRCLAQPAGRRKVMSTAVPVGVLSSSPAPAPPRF